jgi:hypothetical protein
MTTPDLITDIPAGCLQPGDRTSYGAIQQVSLTAYRINGDWYPFAKIHGRPAPATPLVTLIGSEGI